MVHYLFDFEYVSRWNAVSLAGMQFSTVNGKSIIGGFRDRKSMDKESRVSRLETRKRVGRTVAYPIHQYVRYRLICYG
jgi:hypothetical protein